MADLVRILVFSPASPSLGGAESELHAAGFELVGQCTTWRDARDLAVQVSPDLILAVLAGEGAAECAEQVHRLAAERAVPLVFCAGKPLDERLALPPEWSERCREALRRESLGLSGDDVSSRYRGLFHDHPSPMWVFDPASGRIRAVNRAACVAYGYTRDEFLALPISALVSGGHAPWRSSRGAGDGELGEGGGPPGVGGGKRP